MNYRRKLLTADFLADMEKFDVRAMCEIFSQLKSRTLENKVGLG